MFNKIWKEQIAKPKGKLGIWKPKEKLRPREEEDRDCCQEAKDELSLRFNLAFFRDTIERETCEEFRKNLKESIDYHSQFESDEYQKWAKTIKEILEEWEECENV